MAVANTHEGPHIQEGEEHGPVLEATEARAGRRGLHVLAILVVSMTLAVVALLGLLAVQGRSLSGPGGQTTTQQPTASQPLSAARQAE